jgi:hypothetical protein
MGVLKVAKSSIALESPQVLGMFADRFSSNENESSFLGSLPSKKKIGRQR